MPLISPGCTSMPREKCAGGCGQTAGSTMSDGLWWCAGCGDFPESVEDGVSGVSDCFGAAESVHYHNGVRYTIRHNIHGKFLLRDGRQLHGKDLRRVKHLLP